MFTPEGARQYLIFKTYNLRNFEKSEKTDTHAFLDYFFPRPYISLAVLFHIPKNYLRGTFFDFDFTRRVNSKVAENKKLRYSEFKFHYLYRSLLK